MKKMLSLSRELMREVHQKWFGRDAIKQEYAEWQKKHAKALYVTPAQSRSKQPCVVAAQSHEKQSCASPAQSIPSDDSIGGVDKW